MIAERIALPERPRILVIALQRLGDVLLATPLIRSIRRAWPDAAIDALVFANTAGILDGNPDIDRVIAMPAQPSGMQSLAVGWQVLRRYDLAVSTQSGDRPVIFAIVAGGKRLAPVEARFNGQLKRALLQRAVPFDSRVHRVEMMLRLVDALGIPRVGEVVPPVVRVPAGLPEGDIAVVHGAPMFHYKRWTVEGWRVLADALRARGLTVVATGGPAPEERAYLDAIWTGMQVVRRDGLLGWPEICGLLARARVFVGPDTSVTHLAAAVGCPTVALYGPTDPRLWGPWPANGLTEPWKAVGPVQRRGNVWLAQHVFPCTPCQLEGCERRLDSDSECMRQLPPGQLIEVVSQALLSGHPGA